MHTKIVVLSIAFLNASLLSMDSQPKLNMDCDTSETVQDVVIVKRYTCEVCKFSSDNYGSSMQHKNTVKHRTLTAESPTDEERFLQEGWSSEMGQFLCTRCNTAIRKCSFHIEVNSYKKHCQKHEENDLISILANMKKTASLTRDAGPTPQDYHPYKSN